MNRSLLRLHLILAYSSGIARSERWIWLRHFPPLRKGGGKDGAARRGAVTVRRLPCRLRMLFHVLVPIDFFRSEIGDFIRLPQDGDHLISSLPPRNVYRRLRGGGWLRLRR